MDWYNELFDLAAVASGAGLLGGAGAAGVAAFISGAIMRFLLRTLLTAALTGVGFLALLYYLGFEIVPRDEVAAAPAATETRDPGGVFSPQMLPDGATGENGETETAEADPGEEKAGRRVLVVKSPFRSG